MANPRTLSDRPPVWLVLGAILAAEVVGAAGLTVVLPGMAAWLRIYKDPVHVGWIVSAFLLVSAMSAALIGRFGDLFGRKRVMLAVLAVVLVGAAVSASAESLGWLIAGRAIQGVCGGILPLAIGLARDAMPPERSAFSVGLLIGVASLSATICIMLGGVLIDTFGLASLFLFLIALAAVALLAVGLIVPASAAAPVPGRIDWLGGVLFAPAVALVLIALSNARTWGWLSPVTLGLIAAGATLAVVWVRHELGRSDPLLDVRLLANRAFALPCLMIAVGAVSLMQQSEMVLLLAQQPTWTGPGLGLSATAAGALKLPATLAGTLASVWAGWIAGRREPRFAMLGGTLLLIACMTLGLAWHDSVPALLVFAMTGSGGLAMAYAAATAQIVRAVPAARTSEATGFMAVFRALSQGIGSQLMVILLGSSVVVAENGTRFPSSAAFDVVIAFMLGAAVVMLGLAGAVSGGGRKQVAQPA